MSKLLVKSFVFIGLLFSQIESFAQQNDCSNAPIVNPTFNCQIPQSFYTNQQFMFAHLPEAGGDFGLSNYPVYAGSAAQRDQWVKFLAPASNLNVEIRPNLQNTPYYDPLGVEIYSGSCDNLTLLAYNPNATGVANETDLSLTNLTIGQEYYIRVLDYFTIYYDSTNVDNEYYTRNFYVNLCYDCVGLSSSIATVNNVSTTNCEGSVPLIVSTQSGVTFQWYKQGVLIPNATDSIYLATESGGYSCVVSSPSCTNTSNVVNVIASAPASITINGQTAVCNGQSTLLQANQGLGFTYQWSQNGVQLTTANSSSLVVSEQGTYSVEVTNGSCISSAQTIITVGVTPVAPDISSLGSLVLCNGSNVSLEGIFTSGINYQWTLNGDSIANATSANYTANVAGIYCLVVSNTTGCRDTSNCIIVTNCVGFETLSSSDISLYPNPASQLLTMEIPSNYRISSIEILDMQGRTIHVQAYNSSKGNYQVPISEISNGIYFISICTDQGNITKRFVKSE